MPGSGPRSFDIFNPYEGYAALSLTLPACGEGRVGARASSGTGSNGAMPSRSTPAYQGRGTAPVLFERRQSGQWAQPHGHVHRQHRASSSSAAPPAPARSRFGPADTALAAFHSKRRRLDHVRQIPELTGCDTGDHRLAAITLKP